jgi:hypothetical protein
MYMAAPGSGTQPFAASTIVKSTTSSTPSATPLEDPMLDRMSLRTTPLWLRMFLPFDPSPGNGPAVSGGMIEHVWSAAVGLAVEVEALVADVVSTDDGAGDDEASNDEAGAFESLLHPNRTADALAPNTPKALSAARRVIAVLVSKARGLVMTQETMCVRAGVCAQRRGSFVRPGSQTRADTPATTRLI